MANVVLGITGGIAAYKATAIIRGLSEIGHNVKVIPTPNALRFIGKVTLEALSHNLVDIDLFTDVDTVKHVALGQEADVILIAPATANSIAKIASGMADDLLGNTILASNAVVIIAPAMHTEMWLNQATQSNVAVLRARGFQIVEPDTGRLTGDDSGVGRLPEPQQLIEHVLTALQPKDLVGKHFLVTAGGTQEPIDPVRYIGNRSSGKQGIAIARAAARRGATVTLVAANTETIQSPNIAFVPVQTAVELEQAVNSQLNQSNVLVMCAAVSDYRVEHVAQKKIKRSIDGNQLDLRLVANPDILASAVSRVRNEGIECVTVGFAAETADDLSELTELAESKLLSKGCDIIVANNVSNGQVFDTDQNEVVIIGNDGLIVHDSGDKVKIANSLLDIIGKL